MDKNTEQDFIKKYIDKNYQDRLLFELSAEKRRQKALSRFSHNAEAVLKKNVSKKIIASFNEFNENEKTVYIISCDNNDGTFLSLTDAIIYCENTYMSVIIIGEKFALIKEETEKGTPKMIFLKMSNSII